MRTVERCEACGRALTPAEGKVCGSCQAAIMRSLREADIIGNSEPAWRSAGPVRAEIGERYVIRA